MVSELGLDTLRWVELEEGAPAGALLDQELDASEHDLVVLATGMEPSTLSGFTPDVQLDVDDYGFVVPKLAQADKGGGGVFPAGVATGPKDVSSSVQSATAAALRAVQTVSVRGGPPNE